MAQAQLFGKSNELHLGFVLVGAACHLEELPWGGSVVSSMHGGPQPSLPAPWGQPAPTQNQSKPAPTWVKAHAEAMVVPTWRPRCGGSTVSSSACRMRSGQASTFTLWVASTGLRSHPRSRQTRGSLPGCC